MHLTTTNLVSGVWRQNTRAGVIPAISFTCLSRRNARISAHAMRMRAYVRIFVHGMRMRAFSRMGCECAHFAHAMRMLAHARISPHAMRCECTHAMRCECAHQGGTYACPVLYQHRASGREPRSSGGNCGNSWLFTMNSINLWVLLIWLLQCPHLFTHLYQEMNDFVRWL